MSVSKTHSGFHLSSHPVLAHKLSELRRKDTSPKVYRELVREITFYLGYEATSHVETKEVDVETTLGTASGKHLSQNICIVPIMRAGLTMVDPMLELLPTATVHHIGMYRDKRALVPILYYNKLPAACNADIAFVMAPMIATAGSVSATVDIIKRWGCSNIVIMTVLAARAGLDSLLTTHPDLRIHVAAVDNELTDEGQIFPGIGDIGDRMFNSGEVLSDAAAGAGAGAAEDEKPSPSKRARPAGK